MAHACLPTMMLLSALSPVPRQAPPKAVRVTAIVGADVIPMDGGFEPILENHTVIVRDGRIAEVGPSDQLGAPEGARVIDGHGLHLMPGLAEMHVHLWNQDELVLNPANGVTAVRNMWGSELQLDWRHRIEAGDLLGPTIYTTGPLMDGKPPIWPTSVVVDSVGEARQQVRAQSQAGYGALKVYNRLHREVHDAIVETAREEQLPVVGHVPDAVGLRHALESGQQSIEHLTGYLEACRTVPEGPRTSGVEHAPAEKPARIDPEKAAEFVELTRRTGTWNCVTLIVVQRWVGPDQAQRFLDKPEMRYVSPSTKASWNPQTRHFATRALLRSRVRSEARRSRRNTPSTRVPFSTCRSSASKHCFRPLPRGRPWASRPRSPWRPSTSRPASGSTPACCA